MRLSNSRGSALLIAMFIMASVGVVSFSVAKIFVSEIRSTGSIIGGTAAYYGAEGAMEHLLLQYQIDKRSQFPTNPAQKTTSLGDLTSQISDPSSLLTVKGRMYYQGDGNALECKETSPCVLAKDTTAEITLPADGVAASSIKLNWDWTPASSGIMRITNTLLRSTSAQYQHDQGIVNDSSLSSNSETLFADSSYPTLYRFRPLKESVKYWFSGANPASSTLYDLGKTTIDTQGTFGKSSRQLQATIDNSTGSLQSIFDYTILTKDDL